MKAARLFLAASIAGALILACVTSARKETVQGKPGAASMPQYYGTGQGTALTNALNAAKMAAIREAVLEMVGPASEAANRSQLKEVLYNSANVNAYVFNDTLKILSKSGNGDAWNVEISIAVNLAAVENLLRANNIWGGKLTPGSEPGSGAEGAKGSSIPKNTTAVSTPPRPFETDTESAEESDGTIAPPTEKEKQFISKYAANMSYMVYFNEDAGEDPFLMKSAVGIADSFLSENGVQVVDFNQIENLKKDQELVYEEQTGSAISMIQWIAQKLNADVYIEIDARTSGETQGSKYKGKAIVTLKIYEAS
ncbi:MAG: hypothetical protein AB1798_15090, partial [Spirochaetota bacterium]